MSDEKNIKVTDKRMFTPDGQLREEYRERVDESGASSEESPPKGPSAPSPAAGILGPDAGMPDAAEAAEAEAAANAPGAPSPTAPPQRPPERSPSPSPPAATGDDTDEEGGDGDYPSGAQFEDLIGLLAQGASVYIQQARRPERRSEHLELARLHVDLLAILKEKTEGNISARDKALLDDAIYQLRMAVVQLG